MNHKSPDPFFATKKARGRTAQAKGKNLMDRFIKYKEEVLRFCTNFSVPFTNNLAERGAENAKSKREDIRHLCKF